MTRMILKHKFAIALFGIMSIFSFVAQANCTNCGAGPGGSWMATSCPQTCCKSGATYNVTAIPAKSGYSCTVEGSVCAPGTTCSSSCGCS